MAINDDLSSLGGSPDMAKLTAFMEQIVRQNEMLRRGLVANNKEIEVYGYDLHSIQKDTTNIELSFKRIAQLQKTMMHQGASKSMALDSIKSVSKEYEGLLKTINKTHGGAAYIVQVTKQLNDMKRALVVVERQSANTWDTEGIQAVNAQLKKMHQNVDILSRSMKEVPVTRMRDEFRSLGGTIDDAFRNRLSIGLRKIPVVGHVMQAMDMNRRFREAGAGVQAFQAKRGMDRNDIAQKIANQRAKLIKKEFGSAGIRTLNAMGHPTDDPGGTPRTGHRLGRLSSQLGAAAGRGVAGTAGATGKMQVGTIHADTVIMGKRVYPGKGGSSLPQAPGSEEVGRNILTHADFLHSTTRENSLYSKMTKVTQKRLEADAYASPRRVAAHLGYTGGQLPGAMDLAHGAQGGPMVDKAASLAGSLLKMGPVFSGALGLVKMAVSLHDQVAESNLKISGALAGGGMFGGGGSAYDNLHNVRKSLISTTFGQQMLYGQGFEKNLDIYKTLGESGLATGHTLNQGINLGDALSKGEGFHGAVMQNAVQYGRLSGFNQQESAKLTLKLIEKFGQTTDATKQFFVELNEFSNTSGISASRIVEMVDNVTDQFTDLQKSLIGTVDALHKVGAAGIFMGKRVEDTVKGLTKPLEMSPGQRLYNIRQQMDHGGGATQAAALRGINADERSRLLGPTGVLRKYGLDENSSQLEILAALSAPRAGVDADTQRVDMEAYQKHYRKYSMNEQTANDWASGNAMGVLAAHLNGGENASETLGGRVRMMHDLAASGHVEDDLKAALGGDAAAQSRIMHNPVFAMASLQNTFGTGETTSKIFDEAGNASQSGAALVMKTAREAPVATGELMTAGATDQEKRANQAKHGLLTQYGSTVAGAGLFQHRPGGDMAQEFAAYMRSIKNDTAAQGQVLKVLTQDSRLMGDMIDKTGFVGDSIQAQTDMEKEKDARDKAAADAANTTTSDQLMAHAFEYLFNNVITAIDKMADLLPDVNKIRDARAWATTRGNDIKSRIDKLPITPSKQADYDELMRQLAHITEGPNPEAIKKRVEDVEAQAAKVMPNTMAAVTNDRETSGFTFNPEGNVVWGKPTLEPGQVLGEDPGGVSAEGHRQAAASRSALRDAHPAGGNYLSDSLADQTAKLAQSQGSEHAGGVPSIVINHNNNSAAVAHPFVSGEVHKVQDSAVLVVSKTVKDMFGMPGFFKRGH